MSRFHGRRICQLADNLSLNSRVCKWPGPDVSYFVSGTLRQFTPSQLQAVFREAWNMWAEVCGLKPIPAESLQTANVVSSFGRIDGAYGVLAWSELPCDGGAQLSQKYDSGEPWADCDACPEDTLDLVRIAAHEIGHAIGIGHLANDTLMGPYYSDLIRRPQAADIREAVARYGPPGAKPPDDKTERQRFLLLFRAFLTCLPYLLNTEGGTTVERIVQFAACFAEQIGVTATVLDTKVGAKGAYCVTVRFSRPEGAGDSV